MRRGRILLGAFSLAAAVLAGSSTAAVGPPVSGYVWAQPGCAPVSVSSAQPPASVPIATVASVAAPVSGYVWAQPGCAPVSVSSAQPPASVDVR